MSKVLSALALAGVCLTSTPIYADNVDVALVAFHGTCLAHGPDFERTVAAAGQLRWAPLSGATATSLAPADIDSVEAVQGWTPSGSDMPARTMVAVTKATLNGKAVETCSMTLSDIDRPAFEKRFFERTDAEKIGEERNGAQVSSVYILIAGNRKQLVHLMSASSTDTQSMFIASSIAAD